LDAEAISIAKSEFRHPGVEYLVGDALDIPRVLRSQPKFDVVVSYETIEHLSDPELFLMGIKDVLSPGGAIFLSCPNDQLEAEEGIENPYHARTYTFAEFKDVTARILGPASDWYFGAPSQGVVIGRASSKLMENTSEELRLLVDGLQEGSGRVLPAQKDHRVLPDACSFYLGVWGATAEPVQVAAPMSRRSYLGPFRTNDRLRSELEAARDTSQAAEGQLARMRQRLLFYAQLAEAADDRARGVDALQTAEHLEAKQAQADWDAFRRSRTYRIQQAYIRLYDLPGIGSSLRVARRLIGALLRSLKRHITARPK
jgi:hypothetical protein